MMCWLEGWLDGHTRCGGYCLLFAMVMGICAVWSTGWDGIEAGLALVFVW